MLPGFFPTPLGADLAIAGAALTTSWQNGPVRSVQGCYVDEELIATFKSGTSLTATHFRLAVSDDNTNFEPLTGTLASTGADSADVTITAVAASTVRDRLASKQRITAKYFCLQTKIAGTPAAGDAAASKLTISE